MSTTRETGDVAVIVVNYGTADLTIEAIDSVVSRKHGGRTVEVHVLDNASPGEDAKQLDAAIRAKGWETRVTLWAERENHGFGRGNNVVLTALAARARPPEFVFLLNPDAALENEAISHLADALDARAEAAVAGAALLRPDGTGVSAAFRFPGLVSECLRLANFGPVDRLLGRYRVALPEDQEAGPVDWVSGAAVMFRMQALEDVGFFDPAFFLYYEEVDLMRRLGQAGHLRLYVPSARVTHIEGAATNVEDASRRRRPAYLYQSWRHYFTQAHGRLYALMTAVMMVPAAAFNILQRRLRGLVPSVPAGFFTDHFRHVVRPLALAGRSAPRPDL